MNEKVWKAVAFLLIVVLFITLASDILNTWPFFLVPAIALTLVFIYFLYLNQNSTPPFKGQIVLYCPKCGIELTADAEFCQRCRARLPT